MRSLTAILASVLLLPASISVADVAAQESRCKLSLVADLDVEIGQAGGVAVPVTLNGREVRMLLDLRSGISNVFSDALDVTGLEVRTLMHKPETGSRVTSKEQNIRSGDKALNRMVAFDSLRVGNVNFGRFEALVAEGTMPRVREGARPIVGMIGSAAFRSLDVELDLSMHKVRLFKASECKAPPVYWDAAVTSVPSSFDRAGTLSFTMQLDGQKIVTAFDTTRRESSLDSRATARYFGFKPDAPELERAQGPGGEVAMYRAMTLSAEGLNVRNARVRLQDRSSMTCKLGRVQDGIGYDNCFNTTPFVIGTDLLQRVRLIVASKQNRIYFSAATSAVP